MIFVRHPETEAPAGLCYGSLDLGPGPMAEAQMARALDATPPIHAIRSSDLTRCRILAERFAARDGVEPVYDPRLREYDFGAWEGLSWSEIPRAESEQWTDDLWNTPAPGGENFATVHARVGAALADCTPGTLVVCHAGVIRAARMILTGASFEAVFAEQVPFCEPLRFTPEAA